MKTPCRVTDQYIGLSCLCGIYGIIDHRRRISAVRAADHIDSRAVRPLCKLVSCSRPECVRSGDQHLLSLSLQDTGELSHRCGLTDTVDTDHKYDRLLLLKIIRSLTHTHLLLDALDQELLALGRLSQMPLLHILLHALDDVIGRIDADIPHDQDLLELLIKIVVDLRGAVKHRIDPRDDIVPCLI